MNSLANAPVADLERRLARPEVREAYLFGARATGRAQPHSDIDVAAHVDDASLNGPGFGYAAELTAHRMAALRWAVERGLQLCIQNALELDELEAFAGFVEPHLARLAPE